MERHVHRRRRPALSCVECRRRKIRCNRDNPCANCTTARTQCSYKIYSHEFSRQRQSLDHSPPGEELNLLTPVSTSFAASQPAPQVPEENNTMSLSIQAPKVVPDLNDLLGRVRKLEQSLVSSLACDAGESARGGLALQSDVQDAQISQNKMRVLRWSHWEGGASEFNNIIACYNAICDSGKEDTAQENEHAVVLHQTNDILRNCKVIARAMKAKRPSRILSHPRLSLSIPTREISDVMVGLYFQHFESTYRILHIPSFWSDYQRYWHDPDGAPADLRLRVLLVVAIGSSLAEHTATDAAVLRGMIHQWVHAAQMWLSGPLEKDRLEVSGIQIHCLVILARQLVSIGGDLIWMSMGSLIHRAMQIGLHRSSRQLPAMSLLQTELRKRLWATIMEMLVQASLDSSMPPRMSLEEFDTEAPSNIDDSSIDQSTTEIQPLPRDCYTATSTQLVLLESLPTRLRIVQLLNGLHHEISYADVLTLDLDMQNACRACSHFIDGIGSALSLLRRDLLDYQVRRFLVPLHLPFASEVRSNPLFHYSLKCALDTASILTSSELDKDFSRLMVMAGGMFKEGFRSASTIISLALLTQTESARKNGALHRAPGSRDVLKRAMEHLISLSTQRIQYGETNIKSHMFLSMAMAEVESMEQGGLSQQRIAQSAKDSIEFCYGLLQRQATGMSLTDDRDLLTANLDAEQEYDLGLDFFLMDDSFP